LSSRSTSIAKRTWFKSFNARHQSTLIAFKGARETSRLVGETGAAPIEDLLKSYRRACCR
jgi:hypothetical protein